MSGLQNDWFTKQAIYRINRKQGAQKEWMGIYILHQRPARYTDHRPGGVHPPCKAASH